MEHVVTPSEEKKGFDYEGFVKKWLWLIAIVFAAIVFIGLAFPQFEANAIEVTGGPIVVDGKTTSGYIFTALDEVEYGFGALFANGGNWMVLWLYFLPLISLILLIISPFCGKYSAWLSLTAAITSLVAGILFFVSPTLFAYGECWQAIGNDIALDYGDPGFIYLEAAAPQFLPGTIVIASLSLLSSLISFSLSASLVSISIRDISEIGILSALAIALQFIKIQVGPDGGSINLGLVPDTGATYLLTRLIGPNRTMELAATGRPVGAEEAKALGLAYKVTTVEELDSVTMAFAKKIAAGPLLSYKNIKKQIYDAMYVDYKKWLDETEVPTQRECSASMDFQEGCKAFMEKRKAIFQGK